MNLQIYFTYRKPECQCFSLWFISDLLAGRASASMRSIHPSKSHRPQPRCRHRPTRRETTSATPRCRRGMATKERRRPHIPAPPATWLSLSPWFPPLDTPHQGAHHAGTPPAPEATKDSRPTPPQPAPPMEQRPENPTTPELTW